MTDHLEKQFGKKVTYVPVVDYGAAVAALAADKVDFAWLGGFTFVQARHLTGAVPLCMRDVDRKFKSVIIANTKSKIDSPKKLKGKKFAFGSKSSTSGHLMPRHFLSTEFKIDVENDFDGAPIFSGAHDATVKIVESGKVDAGALNIEVWERLLKEGKVDTSKIAVIWTTPEFVDYVWAGRKGLQAATLQKFKKAFVTLDSTNPDHQPIMALQGAKKFVPASENDFDSIEKVARSTGLLQ